MQILIDEQSYAANYNGNEASGQNLSVSQALYWQVYLSSACEADEQGALASLN